MKDVIPGIYQLQMPLPGMESLLGYVNAYLIKGDKGYLIVDTGLNPNTTVNSLKSQMAEIGASLKDISQIVCTHIHPDHTGANAFFAKQGGGSPLSTKILPAIAGLIMAPYAPWSSDRSLRYRRPRVLPWGRRSRDQQSPGPT